MTLWAVINNGAVSVRTSKGVNLALTTSPRITFLVESYLSDLTARVRPSGLSGFLANLAFSGAISLSVRIASDRQSIAKPFTTLCQRAHDAQNSEYPQNLGIACRDECKTIISTKEQYVKYLFMDTISNSSF